MRFAFEQLGSASVAVQAHEDCIQILKGILRTEKGVHVRAQVVTLNYCSELMWLFAPLLSLFYRKAALVVCSALSRR